eukprot:m.129642 g.129642  ORF g.129642 m.129642 type:complete len:59 (-) comp16410_c0_seq6:1011-1187(-)
MDSGRPADCGAAAAAVEEEDAGETEEEGVLAVLEAGGQPPSLHPQVLWPVEAVVLDLA